MRQKLFNIFIKLQILNFCCQATAHVSLMTRVEILSSELSLGTTFLDLGQSNLREVGGIKFVSARGLVLVAEAPIVLSHLSLLWTLERYRFLRCRSRFCWIRKRRKLVALRARNASLNIKAVVCIARLMYHDDFQKGQINI